MHSAEAAQKAGILPRPLSLPQRFLQNLRMKITTQHNGGIWDGYLKGHPELHERDLTEQTARREPSDPGRRQKPTKDNVIRMRVSADQKRAILATAERDRLEVSQWLRQLALRAAGALLS